MFSAELECGDERMLESGYSRLSFVHSVFVNHIPEPTQEEKLYERTNVGESATALTNRWEVQMNSLHRVR